MALVSRIMHRAGSGARARASHGAQRDAPLASRSEALAGGRAHARRQWECSRGGAEPAGRAARGRAGCSGLEANGRHLAHATHDGPEIHEGKDVFVCGQGGRHRERSREAGREGGDG